MTDCEQDAGNVLERNQDERWKGIVRPCSADDVRKLRGSMRIEHTLAKHGAGRLWDLLHSEPFIDRMDLTG
ncbi:MAG: hypothetical protein AB9866_03040 [Syntrophobacteraceae bacterium]